MSGKLVSLVYERDVGHAQQSVLVAMADHADDDGNHCFPSVPFLAWKTGYSDRQVQRCIGELRAIGALVVTRPASRYRPNEYAIRLDALPAKPPFRGDEVAPLPENSGDVAAAPLDGVRGDAGVVSGVPSETRGDAPVIAGVTNGGLRGDAAMAPEPSVGTVKEPQSAADPPARPATRAPRPASSLGPGAQAYRDECHLTPNHVQREMLDAAADRFGEERVRAICRQWMARGFKPTNVDAILDVIAQGWRTRDARSDLPRGGQRMPDGSLVIDMGYR